MVASCASTGERQDVHLAPNAPQDRPVRLTGAEPGEALTKWLRLVGPHVEKARATYPQAKRRYLTGLPPRQTFFVTTLLRDQQGHFENVFVVVDQIAVLPASVLNLGSSGGRFIATLRTPPGQRPSQPAG
jgi:hypothetical protein